jgi:S-DNA-T family DNA segregation ATPase FtsK/SpoIIIE
LEPVELGVFEDGTPVRVELAYRNALIGGMIGSGKSGVLNVLCAHLVACRDAAVWGIDLKGGMELRPWAPVLGRLATTGPQAVALLRDALAVRDHRTSTAGSRLWNPAADGPALVIVVDEFAELPEEAKEKAESLARLGRAVMVNLVIATQRPTQEALGGGALRSQCELRVCLRMRERRDVDLILDRGAWAAGWRGDLLDLPGKLLLSDPEHTLPRLARAYLIGDQQVDETAAAYTGWQPTVAVPELAGVGEHDGRTDEPEDDAEPRGRHAAPNDPADELARTGEADALLWRVLADAARDGDGVTVADLVAFTGLSRATVYRRLRALADTGDAEPVGDGRWRAATDDPM